MYSNDNELNKNVFNEIIIDRVYKSLNTLNKTHFKELDFKEVKLNITNDKFKLYILYIDNFEFISAYEIKNKFSNNHILKCDFDDYKHIVNEFIKVYNNSNIM